MEYLLLYLFSVYGINAFEFDMAVKTLQIYRLLDIVQIPAQVIQSGNGPVNSELSNHFNSVWNKEELPQQRKKVSYCTSI